MMHKKKNLDERKKQKLINYKLYAVKVKKKHENRLNS